MCVGTAEFKSCILYNESKDSKTCNGRALPMSRLEKPAQRVAAVKLVARGETKHAMDTVKLTV